MASIQNRKVQWMDPASGRRLSKTLGTVAAAEKFASDRETDRVNIEAGYVEAKTVEQANGRRQQIRPLINKFEKAMALQDVTEPYRRETVRVVRQTVDECEMVTVQDFTTDAITTRLTVMLEEGQSARSRNGVRRAMHLFAKYLMRRKILTENPVTDTETAKEHLDKREVSRSLTFEEQRKLLAVAGDRRLYYLFRLRTGLRVQECGRVKWADIDLKAKLVTLRFDITKNGEPNQLPLAADLIDALQGVLATPGAKLFPTTPNLRTWKRDIERAGIAYDLPSGQCDRKATRNSYVTNLIRAGVDSIMVTMLARHNLPKGAELTFGRYGDSAAVLERKQEAMRLCEQWVEQQEANAAGDPVKAVA